MRERLRLDVEVEPKSNGWSVLRRSTGLPKGSSSRHPTLVPPLPTLKNQRSPATASIR
jgi:hypothetical protein